MRKILPILVFALALAFSAYLLSAMPARACGGLFCQNSPVDQNAERIIFTQNHDGTITAIIQIQYTGSAADFSWILPIPAPIALEDLAVPETAVNAFLELELATAPIFLPPTLPDCALEAMKDMVFAAVESAADDAGVTIYASGEVGPFGIDVIGSEDPEALILWLRENKYRVTEEMEPLIMVYVDEGFSFLAMRLLPDEDVNSISPIQLTYPSAQPMIPLRLTAVAANPDMAVLVWIYSDRQAVPVNYAHMQIPDSDLTFFTFGGNNYRQLIGERANEYGGQAFITEYAAPTSELPVADPLLQDLANRFAYMTRLNTVISPEEMTVDPVFAYDPQAKDVSNIHDLTNMTGLYACERAEADQSSNVVVPFIGPLFSGGGSDGSAEGQGSESSGLQFGTFLGGLLMGGVVMLFLMVALGIGLMIGRRSKQG